MPIQHEDEEQQRGRKWPETDPTGEQGEAYRARGEEEKRVHDHKPADVEIPQQDDLWGPSHLRKREEPPGVNRSRDVVRDRALSDGLLQNRVVAMLLAPVLDGETRPF